MESTINEQSDKINENTRVEYAGFWWRFLAWVIDTVIINTAQSILFIPFFIPFFAAMSAGIDLDENIFREEPEMIIPIIILTVIAALLDLVMTWLYYAIMESQKSQGTLGKMILGLKVTDMDGKRVSFARATGRYFGKIVSTMIILIGYIMAGFTSKKQALHDIMANCLVVKKTVTHEDSSN